MRRFRPRRATINVSLELNLIVELENYAKDRKICLSAAVGDLCRTGLEKHQQKLEEDKFRQDLAAVKEADRILATARPRGAH